MLRPYAFNRHALRVTGTIKEPHQAEISATLGLINASLDDALRYGGNITREAIGAMNLRHDRKYIVVDTKVHMLMAGMSPAIPGWHTDGARRPRLRAPSHQPSAGLKACDGARVLRRCRCGSECRR